MSAGNYFADGVLVKNCQDLCPLQWALFDKWAATSERLLLVGDPDQSIYGWAGADGRRLLSWIRQGRCTRRLAQSYRVPAAPWRFARTVIRQVVDREDAPYHPKVDKESGAPIEGSVRAEYGDDAWFAVGAAQEAGETAFVLSRTNAGCGVGADELERLQIPYLAERGGSVLGRPGAPSRTLRVVMALQEVAEGHDVHPEGARRLVSALSTKGLGTLAYGAKGNLTAVVQDKRSRVRLDDLDDAGLPRHELTDLWRLLSTGQSGGLLRLDPETEAARCFIASVVGAPDVVLVARWLTLYGEDLLRLANLVRVTTCHGSKGREAKVVLIDARHRFRGKMSPEQLDEDRRVLYVAGTRTERDLVLLRTRNGEDWLDMHGLNVE